MIRTILIPVDGSPFGERALAVGTELAQALSARLVIVCVAGRELALDHRFKDADRAAIAAQYANATEEDHLLSTNPRMVEHAQGQVRAVAEAESYVASLAAHLTEQGLQVEAAVPYGAAADGILMEIGLHSADLVVMSANSRSIVGALLAGSVAQAVLARSPVPVLLVPPDRE